MGSVSKNIFATADYVVFALVLGISGAIGIFYGFKDRKKGSEDFLMGGRSLSVLPVSMSIFASFISAIALLGTPADVYTYGGSYAVIALSIFFVIPITAHLYMPIYYNLNITSAYQYLELRFNRLLRTMGSTVFTIHMMMYMPIVLYAPSLALAEVTGIDIWFSVLSVGLVCTFYTSIGGMKAVVWTDLFQSLIMYGAMFVVVFKGASDLGGFEVVWDRSTKGQRVDFFNFDVDPTVRHTFWSLLIGGYFTWMGNYAANQAMVQRYLTISTLRGAQAAIWINLPLLIILILITSLAGLVIYAFYFSCDPITAEVINSADQLFPRFVMETLGSLHGLPGLFVSGIFSGALSTVSSGVNSLAAVTLEDIIKTYIKKDISEIAATRVTKLLAVFYGLVAIGLVYVAQQLGGVLQAALSIHGMVGGPMLGVFTLGMFFPCVNSIGAAVGLLSGFIAAFWIGIGAFIHREQIYNPKAPIETSGCMDLFNKTIIPANSTLTTESEAFVLYRLSYLWLSAIGCIVCVIIGLLVSFASGCNRSRDIDGKLISPVAKAIYRRIPALRKLNYITESSEKTSQLNITKENAGSGSLYYSGPNDIQLQERKFMNDTYPRHI